MGKVVCINMKRSRLFLFLAGIVLMIAGFVLHFYYGPVYIKFAVIGALLFFFGISLLLILILGSIFHRLKKSLKKIKKPKV